jgi:uncharacterized protein
MLKRPSKLYTTIDFEKNGKQTGYIRLPHSVHRSAYGWLPIPIACIKNGSGVTALLISGTHGDEYEGQVALSKLINQLKPVEIQGRVIIVPMANFPAAKAGLRTSPIDEQNLNRIYPGDPDGSPSFMIAHYIESELFSIADYSLDLHSGGSSLHYVPSAVSAVVEDKEQMKKMKELMKAFAAPYSFFFPSGHADGTTNQAASRNNVVSIGTELGGSGTVSPECLQICERGIKRFLQACGVIQDKTQIPAGKNRMLHAPDFSYYCYAMEEGVFEPVKGLGDEVMKGEVAGYTHFPETPGKPSEPLYFEADGVVVCKRIPARVIRGDCVFQLGCDFRI